MRQKHLFQVVVFVVFTFLSSAAWAGGVIGSAETKTGTLNAPTYQDSWTFSGNSGDRVVVTATGTSTGIYPEIFLFAPGDENPEASATGTGASKRLDHQLLQSGTYTIVVQDYFLDTIGTYAISIAKIPGAVTSDTDTDGGNISSAQTRTGNFNLASDTDLFQFTANAGERVVITATGTGAAIYPEIFLYPPPLTPAAGPSRPPPPAPAPITARPPAAALRHLHHSRSGLEPRYHRHLCHLPGQDSRCHDLFHRHRRGHYPAGPDPHR